MASAAFTVKTAPPVVSITHGPSTYLTATHVSISFEANDPSVTFACALWADGATPPPFGPCPGGVVGVATYANLTDDTHYTFEVRVNRRSIQGLLSCSNLGKMLLTTFVEHSRSCGEGNTTSSDCGCGGVPREQKCQA